VSASDALRHFWSGRGIRTKLLLAVLAGAVLPMTLLSLWLARGASRGGLSLLEGETRTAVAQLKADAESKWHYRRGDLLLLAQNEPVSEALAMHAAEPPPYLIDLWDRLDGQIRAATFLNADGSIAWELHREEVRAARSSGSESVVFAPLITARVPISDTSGAALGFVEAKLHPSAILADSTSGTAGAITGAIEDATGALLTARAAPMEMFTQDRFTLDDDPWVAARDTLSELGLTIAVAAPAAAYVAPFQQTARAGLLTLLATIALATLLTGYLTRRFTRSLTELALAADQVGAGRLDARVAVEGEDEIGRVSAAFNTMSENLKTTLQDLASAQALAAVGQYAAQMAHEVRNTLTSVRADLQRAQAGGMDDEGASALIGRALKNTARLNDVISGSLRVARTGTLPLTNTNVIHAIRSAAELVRHEFVERGRSIVIPEIADCPDCLIAGHMQTLEQLFVNLLLNAAQANGDATASVAMSDVEVVVSIRDNGCGMPESGRDRDSALFQTTKPNGTGLGLSIAGQIAKAHGGILQISSNGAGGTVALVRLPKSAAGPGGDRPSEVGERRTTYTRA
jgi:signal transduction histidine kinase